MSAQRTCSGDSVLHADIVCGYLPVCSGLFTCAPMWNFLSEHDLVLDGLGQNSLGWTTGFAESS